jgi:hypothetical protein
MAGRPAMKWLPLQVLSFKWCAFLCQKLNNHVVCSWLFVLQHAPPRLDCVSSKHVWAYLQPV